jgi:hypothetical protein
VNIFESKGGAIAMITTIRSIGQFSAENFNDAFSENYSLAQANILLLLKLYEYQKTAIQTALQM